MCFQISTLFYTAWFQLTIYLIQNGQKSHEMNSSLQVGIISLCINYNLEF